MNDLFPTNGYLNSMIYASQCDIADDIFKRFNVQSMVDFEVENFKTNIEQAADLIVKVLFRRISETESGEFLIIKEILFNKIKGLLEKKF